MSRPSPHEVRNVRRLRSRLGECAVLLKKDGSFPLKEAGTIAAYGSGIRRTVKGGTVSREQLKWNAHWLLALLEKTGQ